MWSKDLQGQEAALQRGLLADLPDDKKEQILKNFASTDWYGTPWDKDFQGQEEELQRSLLADLTDDKKE